MNDRLSALLRLAVPGYARRAKLRAAWGSAGEPREGLFASRAFELMGAGPDSPCVDDKSWRDLEFPALFCALDTTITPLGGQLLYRQMRSYVFDAQQLSRRYHSCRILQADDALREKLQLILTALEMPSAAYIIGAVLGPPPARPKRPWLIYSWASASVIGLLDASIAVANFLHRMPRHCQPTASDGLEISIIDGYHALISQPVANSITLEQRSALISGSNMAGKTAFIKMVGANVVLGHTLGICLAAHATIPRSPVMASIQGEQSLQSGKSRYFAEIEAIRGFVSRASSGKCRVFVIDELFSGTNTAERIAAAKAVLQAISGEAVVLATTHDAELQHLLTDRFDLYYFQEDPAVIQEALALVQRQRRADWTAA